MSEPDQNIKQVDKGIEKINLNIIDTKDINLK